MFIVSNSDLKSLPKVLEDAPANLKYSRIENLFLCKESVKDSAVVFTVLSSAEKAPIEFMLLRRFLCRSLCANAAASLDLEIDV